MKNQRMIILMAVLAVALCFGIATSVYLFQKFQGNTDTGGLSNNEIERSESQSEESGEKQETEVTEKTEKTEIIEETKEPEEAQETKTLSPSGTSYGVFLGAEPDDVMKKQGYDILVIDAQYYSEEQIAKLHAEGKTVYSYINVGSIENFRPYYDDYVDLTIAKYEHWDEERWIDVSSREWQDFLLNRLAPEILGKGVDGLFVDNTDVYYIRHTEEIYNGLTDILHGFKSLDTYVSINGGDSYVYEYLDRGGEFREIADAVNQETVFSKIEWDGNRFSKNDTGEREYFQEYIEKVSASGGDIFLLEYTTDPELIDAIREYTEAHGFRYYASSTLELR